MKDKANISRITAEAGGRAKTEFTDRVRLWAEAEAEEKEKAETDQASKKAKSEAEERARATVRV